MSLLSAQFTGNIYLSVSPNKLIELLVDKTSSNAKISDLVDLIDSFTSKVSLGVDNFSSITGFSNSESVAIKL